MNGQPDSMGAVGTNPPFTPLRTGRNRSALLGTAVWAPGSALIWSLHSLPGWPEWLAATILIFSPLVLVPLALELVAGGDRGESARLGAVVRSYQLPAALLLVVSFWLPTGWWAALLSLPWLVFTGFVALWGVVRLVSRRSLSPAELSVDAGLMYLAIGGGWTTLSRFGARPLEFDAMIVLLTAAHFHFAGFVLPLLTGLAGRAVKGLVPAVAAAGVIAGVPLVAAGITASKMEIRHLELAAVWFLSLASLLVVVLQWRLAARAQQRAVRLLFLTSGAALLVGMTLAAVYALGSHLGATWLEIPAMLVYHAIVNAFGFALPGLLAWRLQG